MLATSTPFRIHDENSIRPGLSGAGTQNAKRVLIHEDVDATPLKQASKTTGSKSARKALCDLSSSQVNQRTPGALPKMGLKAQADNSGAISVKKPKSSANSTAKKVKQRVTILEDVDQAEMLCTRISTVITDPGLLSLNIADSINLSILPCQVGSSMSKKDLLELENIAAGELKVLPNWPAEEEDFCLASSPFAAQSVPLDWDSL